MRFHALACNYDSTIASDGRVDPATAAALRRVVASGRHLILLSRRPLPELLVELPPELFVMVVAEHGGVLYRPDIGQAGLRRRWRTSWSPPLEQHRATPLSLGEVTVTLPADA